MSGSYYLLRDFAPTVAYIERDYAELLMIYRTFVDGILSRATLAESALEHQWRMGQLYANLEAVDAEIIDGWRESVGWRVGLNRTRMLGELAKQSAGFRREDVAEPYRLVTETDVLNVRAALEQWLNRGTVLLRQWAFEAVFESTSEWASVRQLTADVFLSFAVGERLQHGMLVYLVACCRVLKLVSDMGFHHVMSAKNRIIQVNEAFQKETP